METWNCWNEDKCPEALLIDDIIIARMNIDFGFDGLVCDGKKNADIQSG